MRKLELAALALALVEVVSGNATAQQAAPGPKPAQSQDSHDGSAPADSSPDAPVDVKVVGLRRQRVDRTADTVKVGGEELRQSPQPTVFEALAQSVPDMYVTAHGPGIQGISSGATGGIHMGGLGGSPNTQILILEDGVPDFQGLFGHPIPDAYQPFLIDEAIVVRGGDSVLYGTNAMGGAILFRTRWRKTPGWEVENDGAVGSYSTVRESAAFLGNTGPVDIAGGVSVYRTDGQRLWAGGLDQIGQVAARSLIGNWEITAREKVMHLNGADPGTVQHPYDDHWYDTIRNRLELQALWKSSIAEIRVTPYFNSAITRLYDGFYATDSTSGGILESDILLHRTLKLLLGTSLAEANGQAENRITATPYPLQAQRTMSYYDQLSWEPFKKFQIVAGTREVFSNNWGGVFLYKAGVRWALADGWYIRARGARNYRQPTLSELYFPFPAANPNLKPEESFDLDAGFGYASHHIDFSAIVYRNDVTNMIRYFGQWPAADVVNIDHTVIPGIEAQAALKAIGPMSFRLGANWQDVGRYTQQNPSARLVFAVQYAQNFNEWNLSASLEGQWVHGLYAANYSQSPMPDIFVLDLALRARHGDQKRGVQLEPYLMLRNLLDAHYAYVPGYTMPGFNLLAGLRIAI